MKKIILLISLTLFGITSQAQDCYTVKNVQNLSENIELSSNKYIFGIKQMGEELISDKLNICVDGIPINIVINSIEAPSVGISIGPFMIKRKTTIVNTSIIIGDKIYQGIGEGKISVKATFIELRDENLPFEQSSFSSSIKKSLIDAINKI
jgi:hypothetical protein